MPFPPLVLHRLPGEQSVLAGCDNGCVEVYGVQRTVLCETESCVQAHDDMVLGVALLAGGEKAVTVGQDRKSACKILQTFHLDKLANLHVHVYTCFTSHPGWKAVQCILSLPSLCGV